MASPLWQSYQDPATRDLIEMLQHAARAGDVAAQQQLEIVLAEEGTPTGIIHGRSGAVNPNYLGNVVPGRPRYTRPVGMTDAEVDYWSRYGGGLNFMGRQPAQGAATGVTAMPRTGSQAYGDLAKWRASQPPSRLPMGLPSGYGQEEGGMESGLPRRPSGTFARDGEEHDPRFGGPWEFGAEGQPMGWLRHGGTDIGGPEVKSAGRVGDDKEEGPTRGTEAEEGPSSWWETALEMMQAAGQEMGDEKGTAFQAGGGTGQYPGPYMTGPATIMGFAPTYLGKRKKEERYE